MLVLAVDDAVQLIEPFREGLVLSVEQAFEDYTATGFNRHLWNARVRPNMIWNQIMQRAEERLSGLKGFRVDQLGHYQGFVLADRVFLRPKQAPDGLKSRNYRTGSASKFLDQQCDLFDGIARLELLYTLDHLKSKVEKVQVTQRHLNHVLWAIDLRKGIEPDNQLPIPFEPVSPVGRPSDRIIKPKKSGEEERAVPRQARSGD